MVRVGRHHELPPAEAEQVVRAHHSGYPLGVHFPTAPPQFGGDPRPAIAGKLQSDALDFIP